MSGKRVIKAITIFSATLVAGGAATTSYAGIEIYKSKIEESRSYLPTAQKIWREQIPKPIPESASIPSGRFLGTIYIATLSKTISFFQGTAEKELSRGAGHYVGSVLPGVVDNSVIAGHRDTVFSSLGKVKIGAQVIITTKDGVFTYKVNKIRIVGKFDRTIIVPTELATLTLSTCYPFNFVGAAPKRYIVIATMIKSESSYDSSV